jgi:hypothetical protein
VRSVNAADCAVLRLVLTGKWYDMIASGHKSEEYRDLSDYWTKRLKNWRRRPGVHVVAFSRGYRKADLFFLCLSCAPLWRRIRPEWGEPPGPHFVICLGERVELEDEP